MIIHISLVIYIYTWVKGLDVGQAYSNPLPFFFFFFFLSKSIHFFSRDINSYAKVEENPSKIQNGNEVLTVFYRQADRQRDARTDGQTLER